MDKKREILQKYEQEAIVKNNDEWLNMGGSVRVPEGKAAHYFIERKVNTTLKVLDNDFDTNADTLEIGCSFGHMTSLLAKRFNKLTAVDLSPTSVEIAEKRLKKYGQNNVAFFADDAEVLSKIEDNSKDIIFSFSTIRFCPNQEAALTAIHSKLRSGGVALIDFPNKYSPWHIFVKALSGIKKHIHDKLDSEKELIEMFERCGYKVEKTKIYLFTTKRLPSALLPVFKLLDAVFEALPLFNRLGGIILIKARKL